MSIRACPRGGARRSADSGRSSRPWPSAVSSANAIAGIAAGLGAAFTGAALAQAIWS
ncbi:hypothetical protein [Streptomyces malaysiensis]|uniref:hypothetical protein n=1 Tax=Streptomyces malaysiensis TaxID=92644 RepID=UPI003710F34A